nr:unnamed protein product [Callosobruchus analis]
MVKIKAKPLKKVKVRQRALLRPKPFTQASYVNEKNAIDVAKEPSPYRYPDDFKRLAHGVMTKAWRKELLLKELKVKCVNKPDHRSRAKKDILRRVYVEDEPLPFEPKSVLDVDPMFFKDVEGRPVADKLNVREYITTIREALRTQIVVGYREDDLMLLEEHLIIEQKVVHKITRNLHQYFNIFEELLFHSHMDSMEILHKSESLSDEANQLYEEQKSIMKKYAAVRTALYISEERWKNCLLYQKFLYTMSPLKYKNEHPLVTVETYSRDLEASAVSLSDIIEEFKDTEKYGTPDLYFTEPDQLIEAFRFMELQNLNSLLYSEELAIPLETLKFSIIAAEEQFGREIQKLEESIATLEGEFGWKEERAKYLEDLAQELIYNEFKELVMADKILNLHVFVEDVYETRVAPNDANLSMQDMITGITLKYRQEVLALDKVPSEMVLLLEGSCYKEQLMMMKLAEKAAKQYAELQRLTNDVKKAFGPKYEKPLGKPTMKRSRVVDRKRETVVIERPLTDKEEEYLEFFTDYCKYTDDPLEYGINVREEREVVSRGSKRSDRSTSRKSDQSAGQNSHSTGRRSNRSADSRLKR